MLSRRLPGSIMMEVAAPVLPVVSDPGREETRQLCHMIPIIYHPQYNITVFGLERLHPFDGLKYRRIHDALIAEGFRKPGDFVRPEPVGPRELSRIHTPEYLRSLRRSKVLAEILNVPLLARLPAAFIDWRVLRPMRYATGGTILACRMALESGWRSTSRAAITMPRPRGATAPASTPTSRWPPPILHAEGLVERVLVVDLDAHQGNGTAATIQPWPWASILDVYEDDLFPTIKQPEDFPIPIPAGLEGPSTWRSSRRPAASPRRRRTRPGDLQRGLRPVRRGPARPAAAQPGRPRPPRPVRRDAWCRERGIPMAMVLSGGYARESWRVHADGIEAILRRFDRVETSPAVGDGSFRLRL